MANCKITDIRVGTQIWIYAEINADGSTSLNTIDTVDAEDAVASGGYDEFWQCRNCDSEDWHDVEEALEHLTPSKQAEIWDNTIPSKTNETIMSDIIRLAYRMYECATCKTRSQHQTNHRGDIYVNCHGKCRTVYPFGRGGDNEEEATKSELEAWKLGKCRLWTVDCHILVTKVTETKAVLSLTEYQEGVMLNALRQYIDVQSGGLSPVPEVKEAEALYDRIYADHHCKGCCTGGGSEYHGCKYQPETEATA